VIVIGNPTGLTGTVSDGIISAFRENRSLIQITAPIFHGSSGSPAIDETGHVIGKVGIQPMDMAFRGDELFVACQGDGSVHVIDISEAVFDGERISTQISGARTKAIGSWPISARSGAS
jgi:hypothetical protein